MSTVITWLTDGGSYRTRSGTTCLILLLHASFYDGLTDGGRIREFVVLAVHPEDVHGRAMPLAVRGHLRTRLQIHNKYINAILLDLC